MFKKHIFLTALLGLNILSSVYGQTLDVKQGDFVQGELFVEENSGADLSIYFADQSSRWLSGNVVGKKDFMFIAKSSGKARFELRNTQSGEPITDYQIKILHQYPVTKQKPLPKSYQSPILQVLATNLQNNDNSMILQDFWQKIRQRGTPLVEAIENSNESLVTFLWRGAKQNVWLWGAPASGHEELEHLPNSDIWFKTYRLPNDSFISYGLAPDVPSLPVPVREQRRAILATLQADPFNFFPYPASPKNNQDPFSYYSSIKLAKAPQTKMLDKQNVAKGVLTNYKFHSKILNNSRRIVVYTPPNFIAGQEYGLLLLFDGTDYRDKIPTPQILDNLIAANQIKPTVAVFIDNPSNEIRATELTMNARFAEMIAKELYPWILTRLNFKTQTKDTALSGSSYGGLASVYIANQYPEIFGNALALSSSFWWQPANSLSASDNMAALLANQEQKPVRFFISAGLYEESILQSSRHLKDVLHAKDYALVYREYASDHSHFAWQYILIDGLKELLKP